MTREIMLQVALEHVRRGARFIRDDYGRPVYREGAETDLLGALIPLSLYYETEGVEGMTTYELRDAGVWTRDEHDTIKELDRIQAKYEEAEWEEQILLLLNGEGEEYEQAED